MSKYIVCQKEKNDYEVFGQNFSLYREASSLLELYFNPNLAFNLNLKLL